MIRLFLLSALLISSTGCRARQLQQDQVGFRDTIVELMTEQVMENLILAYRGMPFVHIDYTRSTGTITQKSDAGVDVSQRDVSLIENFVGASIAGGQSNQLTVTAEPVFDQNEVYDAYLEFLNPDAEFGPRLIETCDPPPCGAAHICRRAENGLYYWVPIHYKTDFLKLALVTSVQRGRPLSIPSVFNNQIVDVEVTEVQGIPGEPPAFAIVLTFKSDLYNDTGMMKVPVGDRTLEFELLPIQDEPAISFGKKTKQLRSKLSADSTLEIPKNAKEIRAILLDKVVEIQLDNHRPRTKTTNDLIEDLRAEFEIQRLNTTP